MVLFPLKNSLSLLSSSKTHCSINSFSISGKKGLQKEWFINTVDENHPQKVSLYKYNKITLFQKEVVFIIKVSRQKVELCALQSYKYLFNVSGLARFAR